MHSSIMLAQNGMHYHEKGEWTVATIHWQFLRLALYSLYIDHSMSYVCQGRANAKKKTQMRMNPMAVHVDVIVRDESLQQVDYVEKIHMQN